jgi:hypothetical protein
MPRFEIEVDDKGEFQGALPPEIDAILKRIEITAHGTGFRGGQSKATEDAKKSIEDAIKAERAKIEASLPLEREKWQGIEEENKTLKTQLTDTMRESGKTLTKREEAHAEEIMKRAEAITKRNAKIQTLVNATLKGLAAQSGAREDALDLAVTALEKQIGYDDDMEPYVKGANGEPMALHGKPMPIDAFVKSFIDGNPYLKKPAGGQGGGARGGASFHGAGANVSADAAKARVEGGDRSANAINELFEATRRKSA